VLPAVRMRLDAVLGALLERHGPRVGCELGKALFLCLPSCLERIDAVSELLPQLPRSHSGFREVEGVERAETQIMPTPVKLVSEDPGAPDCLVLSQSGLQVEIAAIGQHGGPTALLRLGG